MINDDDNTINARVLYHVNGMKACSGCLQDDMI